MDELLGEFLTECFENMTVLDVELVKLERNPNDRALIAAIFRIVHTIKGTCGFLGLARLESVAHAAESVLGRFRDGEMEVTPAAVSLVLQALDRIKAVLDGLAADQVEPPGDDRALIEQLSRLASGAEVTAHAAPVRPAEAVSGRPAPPQEPDRDEAASSPAGRSEATAPAAVPAPAEPAPAKRPPEPRADKAAAGEAARAEAVSAQTLRVPVDLLEKLMTLVSELVLTRNQLLQMVRNNTESEFKAPLQRLSHITSELQDGVMKTRMQPIGNAWSKLPRLVRDLTVDLGKQIELEMIGADTELDRQVLELVKDPLTHMVRNSADHGLETPRQRQAAGKPEQGTIRLEAFHEGGQIIIRISDDGRGLNVDRIREKIVAQGLCGEGEAQTLSAQQLMQFIFRPGFSTAAAVTNVSGRGVGMDVVKTNIEKIGGSIELASEPGSGTSFTIRIPLTLAIVAALIVAAGGERFAIPQIGVVELVRAGPRAEHRIEQVDGARILRLRDRLLPLLSLADLLGLHPPASATGDTYVVVSQVGTRTFGLIVDQVFDTEEIVVKPIAPILRGLSMYSGNTILGDGSVVMILDLNAIASGLESSTATAAAASKPADRSSPGEATSLLLFEAGRGAPKTVPLALVTRLEEITPEQVEWSGPHTVMQYRGGLVPLVDIEGRAVTFEEQRRPVLMFTDVGRTMGLVVDRIIDITEAAVELQLRSGTGPTFGSAVIAGRSTELLDVGFFVRHVFGGWFAEVEKEPFQARLDGAPRRVLLVDDSAFVRNLLAPLLKANGFAVRSASCPAEALALRDAGHDFDVIVSDIEMPGMDGFAFAAACRAAGRWQGTPIVALTSHTTDRDRERGREVGFTAYVGKLDKEALMAALGAGAPAAGAAA